MSKHTFGQWLTAIRPWSFPASTMPVLVTVAYLFWRGAEIDWLLSLWAIVNIVVFHAAGNVWSDYFDYRKGLDRIDTFGSRILTDKIFSKTEILTLAIVLLTAAVAGGIGLVLMCGLPVLWIGIAGFVLTVSYPFLKFNALGDIDILLVYAFLPTIGTSFVASGGIDWSVLMTALPIGLITDGILHANNTRDIAHDKRANISTFAMVLGHKAAAYLYWVEMVLPYIWLAGLSIFNVLPVYTVFVFLTFPVALGCARTMIKSVTGGTEMIADLDIRTANLQLMFSVLLAISFVLAGFIA